MNPDFCVHKPSFNLINIVNMTLVSKRASFLQVVFSPIFSCLIGCIEMCGFDGDFLLTLQSFHMSFSGITETTG